MKGLKLVNKSLVLEQDLGMPELKNNQVLVQVMCASVNPTDADVAAGKYALLLKLSGGNHQVKTGLEFSGVIEKGNDTFTKGDKVFGYVDLMAGEKTHQEFIAINADFIAHMPQSLSFEQAAALPLGALTTLVALQELGKVTKDSRVLINGASGGLGVYGVQIANILGANITAMAGPNQEGFLKKLGATRVINYQHTPISELSEPFDVILDLSDNLRFKHIKHLLTESGVFIPTDPTKHLSSFAGNFMRVKKTKYLMVSNGDHEKLSQIARWVDEGKLQSLVDSVYNFANYQDAFERLKVTGKRGRIVMNITHIQDQKIRPVDAESCAAK